jgi:methionyl-tRNA formyltransferase
MRIALLCGESAGARVLEALAKGAHELAAVLTSEGSPAWNLAARLGVSPLPAQRVRDPGFAAELARAGAEVVLNVHSLYIVPPAVLQVPRFGAYNLHPGPLPRYAGLNAPSWAIYNGEENHGVTVHRMEAGIDTGAVVFEERFAIKAEDTGLSVALRCAQKGVELVARLLHLLAHDPSTIPLKPQNPAGRRYFGREVPQGGCIDWNAPARRIYDFVRACDYHPFSSPWGTPRARLGNEEISVLKVEMTGKTCKAAPGTVRHGEDTLVATADEWLCLKKFRLALTAAPHPDAAKGRPPRSR